MTTDSKKRVWTNWMLVPLAMALICVVVGGLGLSCWSYLFASLFPWPSLMPGTPLSAIHRAALTGDVTAIQAELDAGVQPDLRTLAMEPWVDGATPLMLAAYRGRSDAVKHLITAGADVAATDAHGRTPLHWAMYTGGDGIRELLDAGADISARDIIGRTPLMRAALDGDASQVEALLDAGADPHATDNRGRTALDLVQQLAPTRRDAIDVLKAAMRDNTEPEP